MEQPINPFQAPRTADLDGAASRIDGPVPLSREALRELTAAAPWLRRVSRLTSLSIAVGLVKAVADFFHTRRAEAKAVQLFAAGISTAAATLLLMTWRRYAAASERLRADAPDAAADVIAAQVRCVRVLGVLCAIVVGFLALIVFVAGGWFLRARLR
jgi:hypothetical protein